MDKPGDFLRSFDAFPKVPPSNQIRSTRGSFASIGMYVFLFFLFWVEVGGYLDGFIDHQFTVDDVIRKDLKLNMDIAVAMPCKLLNADVRDATNDRLMAAEKLNFEGIPDRIPLWYFENKKKVYTPKLEDVLANSMEARFFSEGEHVNEDLPFCRIYGTIPINRVKGDFHITAKGYGYASTTFTPKESLNFTHFISEFSFGDFYPYLDNPLDMTYQVTDENWHSYHYKLDIVPTMYKKLGLEIDTSQYSMSMFDTAGKHMPGIFVRYDFEPIKMIVAERRLSFWHFVVRLVTIMGGIWIVAMWVYRGSEKALGTILGREFVKRGEEKKEGGLLDGEEFEKI
ncbi:DEKNAAC102105 [Brettanomyces naardenensis]|uniref:Endoplasmic reticulum-Golgi intermediate compartment protein n=1 Tax=Brettanomyces naardenensis TaxID=13370 RepID=A0A448YJX0_BRENA|nr:DEKNAAC102105 [Brettanomyces naardenensis]